MTCGDVHPNPGPDALETYSLRVGTANVTSLTPHLSFLNEEKSVDQVDVWALQETCIAEEQRRGATAAALSRGWTLQLGSPPLRTKTRTGYSTASGGVSAACRADIPMQTPACENAMTRKLWRSKRWCHMGCLRQGHTDFEHLQRLQQRHQQGEADKLISDALYTAASLGDKPVLIAGDINLVPEKSPSLTAALNTGRWIDVAAEMAYRKGTTLVATTTAGKGRRIDVFLVNHVTASAIVNLKVLQGTSILTHLPLMVELDLARFHEKNPLSLAPKPFIPSQWRKATPEEVKREAVRIYKEAQGRIIATDREESTASGILSAAPARTS